MPSAVIWRQGVRLAATVPVVDIAAIVLTVQPGVTDWLTGIGTVAVAVLAVGVALYAERRADKRVAAERAHSAKVLAEERKLADDRLLKQMQHSDAQVLQERNRGVDAEQHAQAWAVEILPGSAAADSDESDTSYMTVLVSNLGTRTITRVEAHFSPDGRNLVAHARVERISTRTPISPSPGQPLGPEGRFSVAYSGILTPGSRMRFWSDEVSDRHLSASFPVVRWSDWLGQTWQHRKGTVRKIGENEPWVLPWW